MEGQRETNTEFVTRMMEFSKHGALMQIFIIDALQKRVERILSISDNDLERIFNNNPMISWEAWKSCAEELKSELDKKYK